MNDEKQPVETIEAAVASNDKIVPKFCTAMDIKVINENLVLSMYYMEGTDTLSSLIERVVIDMNHAKSLTQALLRATNGENDV
jgi:hypothetical protein